MDLDVIPHLKIMWIVILCLFEPHKTCKSESYASVESYMIETFS